MKGLKEIVLIINCSNIISIIDIIPDDLCWCWTICSISLIPSFYDAVCILKAGVLQCNGRNVCPELRNPGLSLELSLYSSGSQPGGNFVTPAPGTYDKV